MDVISHANDAGLRVLLCVSIKFEVSRPSLRKIWPITCITIIQVVTLTCDLLTLELVLNVTRSTDSFTAQLIQSKVMQRRLITVNVYQDANSLFVYTE